MPLETHYLALPFHHVSGDAKPKLEHLVECASESEAVSRAEAMAAYPEYEGAIAITIRRRNGVRYGTPSLRASFGVSDVDLADIVQRISE